MPCIALDRQLTRESHSHAAMSAANTRDARLCAMLNSQQPFIQCEGKDSSTLHMSEWVRANHSL